MKALCEDLYMQVKADLHSANFSHASDTFRWQMPTFQSPFGENEIWVICKATCSVNVTYIPTLPFWTVGSRFQRTAPALPVLPEISRFEMIPVWVSDIYEFFKSITLFTNSIWKSWLLITKLGACVALIPHLYHQL